MNIYDQPELPGVDPAIVPVLRGLMRTQEEMVERMLALEKAARMAFPGGDAEGHRRAHEAMIERTAELRRLRVAIQEKTISGLVWAAVVGLGLLVYHGALEVVKAKLGG